MNTDYAIIRGLKCPYCGGDSKYIDSAAIYNGRSYGMVYACIPCDAHVGVHKGTDRALGRLANKELREAKKAAHAWFDPLWKLKVKQGNCKQFSRSKAYSWLAKQLDIEVKYCHIGMFDVDMCNQVIELCKPLYKRTLQ